MPLPCIVMSTTCYFIGAPLRIYGDTVKTRNPRANQWCTKLSNVDMVRADTVDLPR